MFQKSDVALDVKTSRLKWVGCVIFMNDNNALKEYFCSKTKNTTESIKLRFYLNLERE